MNNTGRLLHIANNHMVKRLNDFSKKFGLTWVQMTLIDFLNHNQPCTQKEIESEFMIQRSTATVMLQRMERKKLIVRKPSVSDNRQRVVILTSQAIPLIENVTYFMQKQQYRLEKKYSQTEIQCFEKMLRFFIEEGN